MMRIPVIITKANHYSMEDNKGVSVRVVGGKKQTNNSFGLDISEASVPDFNELEYLQRFSNKLPAKFNADFAMVSKKASNGKEITGVELSNLEFLNEVEFVDKKVPVKA